MITSSARVESLVALVKMKWRDSPVRREEIVIKYLQGEAHLRL